MIRFITLAGVCGIAVATAFASTPPLQGDCDFNDPGCLCPPLLLETEIQPNFDESCIESVEVMVTSLVPGCCGVLPPPGGPPPGWCPYANNPCRYEGVEILVTPSHPTTVRMGDSGTPTTIYAPTLFHFGDFEPSCNVTHEVTTVQVRDALGWTDVFRLELFCDGETMGCLEEADD